MAQHTWIYKNESGPDYEVGLYHGDQSGHVMIYVGQQIIKIDFSVYTEKKYHFQLGNELVVLIINLGQKGKYKLVHETTGKEIPLIPKNDDYSIKYIIVTVLVFVAILVIIFYVINK